MKKRRFKNISLSCAVLLHTDSNSISSSITIIGTKKTTAITDFFLELEKEFKSMNLKFFNTVLLDVKSNTNFTFLTLFQKNASEEHSLETRKYIELDIKLIFSFLQSVLTPSVFAKIKMESLLNLGATISRNYVYEFAIEDLRLVLEAIINNFLTPDEKLYIESKRI